MRTTNRPSAATGGAASKYSRPATSTGYTSRSPAPKQQVKKQKVVTGGGDETVEREKLLNMSLSQSYISKNEVNEYEEMHHDEEKVVQEIHMTMNGDQSLLTQIIGQSINQNARDYQQALLQAQ